MERCQPYDARGQQHAVGPHRDRVCGSVDFMTVTVKNLRLDDATCGAYVAAHAAVEPMPAFGLCDAFFLAISLFAILFCFSRTPFAILFRCSSGDVAVAWFVYINNRICMNTNMHINK